jgi:hypothetical protein
LTIVGCGGIIFVVNPFRVPAPVVADAPERPATLAADERHASTWILAISVVLCGYPLALILTNYIMRH